MTDLAKKQIHDIRETIQKAENAGRVDLMKPFFGDDLVILAPGSPPVIGAEAADFMAGLFAQYQVAVTYASDEVVIMGEWAFDRGSAKQILTPKVGGPIIAETAKYLWIYRGDREGKWKVARVIWNSSGIAPA